MVILGSDLKDWFDGIIQDVREAIENLHEEKILKLETINNLENLVTKDPRLPTMLRRSLAYYLTTSLLLLLIK